MPKRERPSDMTRLDTWIPEELMRKLRVKSVLESKTIGQVVAEILKGSLK